MSKFSDEMPAGEFKAKCLKLMDEVRQTHKSIIITKHGKGVAKLVPIEEEPPDLFGLLRGSISIQEDLTLPLDEPWEADK